MRVSSHWETTKFTHAKKEFLALGWKRICSTNANSFESFAKCMMFFKGNEVTNKETTSPTTKPEPNHLQIRAMVHAINDAWLHGKTENLQK